MVFLSRLLRATITKESLLSLRKTTGHSFQHCRKALEESNNNINEAVKWLEKESLKQGWTKLERAAARSTKEGVFGVASADNLVAVTEINCETDFVARNSELRGFAAKISTNLCGEFSNNVPNGTKLLNWDEISQYVFEKQSVEEGRARLVAKVGENVNIRRSLVISPPDGEKVAVSCHPDGTFGKYGAYVFYKGGDQEVAEKLCRHIVGMRPTAVGKEEDIIKAKERMAKASEELKKAQEEKAKAEKERALQASADGAEGAEEERQEENEEAIESVDEDLLILQEYVFDQDIKVLDVLRENKMEITKFGRFECGEELVESKAC